MFLICVCMLVYIYIYICICTICLFLLFLLVPAIRGLAYSEGRMCSVQSAERKISASSRDSRRWHDTETHGASANYRANSRAGWEAG